MAAFVVVRHLGTKPLWRDEAISLSVAARPVGRILAVLPHHDANAGFYYLLLHAWLWFGHGPVWARGFSAACFGATAALAAWAGWRWRGWETGLAGGLLVALNPFLIYYGQEARPYAPAVLLAAVSTIALFRWRGARPYLVATVALLYMDLFALLYVGALAAAVAAVHRLRHEPIPAAMKRCWWVIGALAAPLAVVMTGFERGQISWLARPSARVLTTTLTSMSGGGLGLAIVVALAALALAAAASAIGTRVRDPDRDRDRDRDRMIVLALAAAFALPPLTLWVVAQAAPAFLDRYVICSTLAMVGVAAAGLEALRDRLPGAGRIVTLTILAVLLLLAGQGTARLEAQPFKVDNAPAAVDFIRAHSRPGDAVVYAGGGLRTLMESSLTGRPSAGTRQTLPPDIALAAKGQAYLQHDLYAREVTAPELLSRLASVLRLWLVTDPSDQQFPVGGPFAQLKPLVRATFTAGATTSFGAVDVTLLVRRA
ncbi:MAG: hypothetical protein M3083_23235 [Actinomycetota bacterium]|nr:hypothetical protein [Actinomycetota bacterium]MDQ6946162.1 hypothetical protein [Actinomycetota bacterium]